MTSVAGRVYILIYFKYPDFPLEKIVIESLLQRTTYGRLILSRLVNVQRVWGRPGLEPSPLPLITPQTPRCLYKPAGRRPRGWPNDRIHRSLARNLKVARTAET